MSRHQVDDEHIHVLIHAALTYGRIGTAGRFYLPTDQPEGAPGVIPWFDGTTRLVLSEATADRVGQSLRDANTACMNDKYDEDQAYVYAYERRDSRRGRRSRSCTPSTATAISRTSPPSGRRAPRPRSARCSRPA